MTGASEKQQQAAIVELLELIGGEVYVLGTRRARGDYQGTRQTPGLPDLIAFLPHGLPEVRLYMVVAIEVKKTGGRLRPEQNNFGALWRWAGLWYLVGDLTAIVAWLVERQFLEQKGSQLWTVIGSHRIDRTAAASSSNPQSPGSSRRLIRSSPLTRSSDKSGRRATR